MTAWLIRLRDRPIADQERRRAFIASTAVLAVTVALLALTAPAASTTTAIHGSASAAHMLAGRSPVPPSSAPGDGPSIPGVLSPPVARVARGFLTGYLAYLYGHAGVARIADVNAGLERSLAAHPPRVSFDMRARHPRVISLVPSAAPPGAVGVSALVNDGGVANYTVELLVSRGGGRLLVTGIGGA
ncbi:MAG: hypothetical protein WA484_00750 [Solirubrobacteraceae bacterium]